MAENHNEQSDLWIIRAGFALVAFLCAGMLAAWGMMIYDGVGTMTGSEAVAYEGFGDYMVHAAPYMVIAALIVFGIFFALYRRMVGAKS